jgi:hypothetical protein
METNKGNLILYFWIAIKGRLNFLRKVKGNLNTPKRLLNEQLQIKLSHKSTKSQQKSILETGKNDTRKSQEKRQQNSILKNIKRTEKSSKKINKY